MGVPSVIVDENGKRIPGQVPFDEILRHPERHSKAVMHDFLHTPEFCAACHKANLPDTLNDYKFFAPLQRTMSGSNPSFRSVIRSHFTPPISRPARVAT